MKRFIFTLIMLVLCVGYVDAQSTMKESLKEKYGFAVEQTSNGGKWYRVGRDGKEGACDENGKLIIPLEYDDVSVDYEYQYVTAVKDKQTTVFDLKGEILMRTDYEKVRWYTMKKYGHCEVVKNGLAGAINEKGELVVPCIFDAVSAFTFIGNYCRVKKNKLEGVYDISKKELVIPCEYDDASTYDLTENGWSMVKKGKGVNEKVGLYDINKKMEIVPCKYDRIIAYSSFRVNSDIFIVMRDGFWGVSDKSATEIVPCTYSFIEEVYKGPGKYLIAAKGGERPSDEAPARLWKPSEPQGALWGALDLKGNEVVPFKFDYIRIYEDVAICAKGVSQNVRSSRTEIDYSDNKKKYVVYELNWDFQNALFGFFNIKTRKSVDCKYENCKLGGGYIACRNSSGMWGYLDAETMEQVVPFEYEDANPFKDGVAQIKKNGAVSLLTDPKKGTALKLINGGSAIKVDENIPQNDGVQEESFAFIIANENYVHLKGADYAINDGKVFKEYCIKAFGMPENNVRYYEDATFGNMVNAIKKIKDIAEVYEGDAKIIVYFSGLGTTDATGKERYLLPVDASIASLNVTGYSVQKLMGELNALKTKQTIVILDAPFSGLDKDGKMLGENRGVAIAPKLATPQGSTILITGCSGSESAYSLKDYGHSLFTYGLLEKIQDTKGKCSLKEAIDYASAWVKKESLKRFNKTQTPETQTAETMTDNFQNVKF